MAILWCLVNPLTAVLTFFSLIGYAVLYTVWLKHVTPQNIVIGGAAGAAPPVLGAWTAVTGSADPYSLLLFLIIFAGRRRTSGRSQSRAARSTPRQASRCCPSPTASNSRSCTSCCTRSSWCWVTLLPYLTQMSGLIYLAAAVVLGGLFIRHAVAMRRPDASDQVHMQAFRFSINYLMVLFAALLIDHYLQIRP